jgi:hypothetical protein
MSLIIRYKKNGKIHRMSLIIRYKKNGKIHRMSLIVRKMERSIECPL